MKIKAIIHSFLVPFIWILLVVAYIFYPNFSLFNYMSIGVIIGLAIGSTIAAVFFSRRYLLYIAESGNLITFTYLNQFGTEKKLIISENDLTKLYLKKKIPFLLDFNKLIIYHKEKHKRFSILNSELLHKIDQLCKKPQSILI